MVGVWYPFFVRAGFVYEPLAAPVQIRVNICTSCVVLNDEPFGMALQCLKNGRKPAGLQTARNVGEIVF